MPRRKKSKKTQKFASISVVSDHPLFRDAGTGQIRQDVGMSMAVKSYAGSDARAAE